MSVIEFRDIKPIPDVIHTYDDSARKAAILIDNGSYQCRAGWSNQKNPYLVFRNLVAKLRKDRSKKDLAENFLPQILVGNDITNIEAVRGQLKTQFDRNVVTHFETQEHIFDYIFAHLGIDTENRVQHPIVMTEAYLNPNSSRYLMSELLFECYRVPSLTFGVDCLFTYHYAGNKKPLSDALIVNLGYHTIHIIPIINNTTIFENSRRINLGGSEIIAFLQKILQLKYPSHSAAITLSRAEELLHTCCSVAIDYREESRKWAYSKYSNANVLKVQLPYSIPTAPTITVEQQKERKRELAKRLSEINARKREERLAEDEERLQQLLSVQDVMDYDDPADVERLLAGQSLKNIDDLHKTIATLTMKIEKIKEKIVAANTCEDIIMDETSIKQKQKLVFEDEKAQQLYLQNAKRMKQEILNKKTSRRIRRHDMAKRRTAAGQERMRIISQLARKEKGNDDFGLRDEDWDIYKTISREGNDSDSDIENEKLIELEDIIKTYDPEEAEKSIAVGDSYQLHIGLERYRAPELIFKPYMAGSHEAGLSEVIAYVLSLFSTEDQMKLASNIVLTGGLSSLPGLKERLQSDLISVRPFKSFLKIDMLSNNSLSPWQGMRTWSKSINCKKNLVNRKQYEELGYEYLKSHLASNPFEPSPKETQIDVCD